MKILKGVWTALALTLMLASPARADDPPQYVGSLSVTDTTDDVAFINNHSGGDDAPFLAKSITITATGDTCYLDHTDTLSNSLDLAGAAVATEDDIPIVAGEPYVINLGSGYNAPAGWAGLAGICGTGDTATWTITANRYDVPDVDITVEGGEGGAIEVGVTPVTGVTNCFMYADASSFARCASTFLLADDSGAGDGVFSVRKTMSGSSATSNFLNVTGTYPATHSALIAGASFNFTTAGTSSVAFQGINVSLLPGYTGNRATQGLAIGNTVAGTRLLSSGFTTGEGNSGLYAVTLATTTGTTIGGFGWGGGGDLAIGIYGSAPTTKNSGVNYGGFFNSVNAGSTPCRVGVFGGLVTAVPTCVESASVFNNGAVAAPITVWQDNGTTVGSVGDAGVFNFGIVDAANSISINETAGCVTFEGATANTIEGRLCSADVAGADSQWVLPSTGLTSTLSVLNLAQTFTAAQTWSASNTVSVGNVIVFGANLGSIGASIANTPDSMFLNTQATSNAFHVIEALDFGTDFNNCSAGTSAATNPTLCIHSANQNTTQWIDFKHDGTNGVIDVGTGVVSFPDSVTVSGVTFTAPSHSETGSGFVLNTQLTMAVGGSFASFGGIGARTENTPDMTMLYTGTTPNAISLREGGDATVDMNNGLCGTSACTQPGLIINPNAVSTTEYNHINVLGSHGGNVTALTDDTAGQFFHTVTMGSNGIAYSGDGHYTVYVTDAAGEVQQATGNFLWTAQRANTGGSVCSIQHVGHDGVLGGLPLKQLSAGTLDVATNGLECNIATNVANFTMRANTSLTPTTFTITSRVNVRRGPAEIVID